MTVQQLLDLTVLRKASDLHLLVGYPPQLRIHGELIPVEGALPLTEVEVKALVASVISQEQQKVFDTQFELDMSFPYENKARFRVNVYKTKGSVAAELRLIPMTIPPLDTLGLPLVVKKLADLKQGLILVTGPTGHGKSTTMAAIINEINFKRALHIVTVEDPIEYVYPKAKSLVSQREMGSDTKSWTGALRSVLREDPDVVLVGEMRDYETISAAITVAETGHLVFATLHTNSAAQSIDRIIDAFPQNQQPQVRLQLSSTLEAVISQRLIPTIVPGRTLAVELLLRTPALATLIRDAKSYMIDNLIQTSGELGMMSLETSLAKLIKEGKISFDTAQNYCIRPEQLAKLTGYS